MKIVKNCWNKIETWNCQYGAHIFDGFTAKIYVNQWLDVDRELQTFFSKRNDEGFFGHCVFIFKGVKRFDFKVTTHTKSSSNTTIWNDPIFFHYTGSSNGEVTHFEFEGSLHGFPSSVSATVEAEAFELWILDRDEPARGSC